MVMYINLLFYDSRVFYFIWKRLQDPFFNALFFFFTIFVVFFYTVNLCVVV